MMVVFLFIYSLLISFHIMCESIGQFGLRLKPPSMYEARVPLLKKEVDNTEKAMVEHKQEWAQKGCSLLSDGWRDSTLQKDIVNFLVNKGPVFIRSMDVSNVVKMQIFYSKFLIIWWRKLNRRMWSKW